MYFEISRPLIDRYLYNTVLLLIIHCENLSFSHYCSSKQTKYSRREYLTSATVIFLPIYNDLTLIFSTNNDDLV